jgi:hypothetical protein
MAQVNDNAPDENSAEAVPCPASISDATDASTAPGTHNSNARRPSAGNGTGTSIHLVVVVASINDARHLLWAALVASRPDAARRARDVLDTIIVERKALKPKPPTTLMPRLPQATVVQPRSMKGEIMYDERLPSRMEFTSIPRFVRQSRCDTMIRVLTLDRSKGETTAAAMITDAATPRAVAIAGSCRIGAGFSAIVVVGCCVGVCDDGVMDLLHWLRDGADWDAVDVMDNVSVCRSVVRGSVAEGPINDVVPEVVIDRATRREADCVFAAVVEKVAGVTDSPTVAVTVTASWDPVIVFVSLSVRVTDGD